MKTSEVRKKFVDFYIAEEYKLLPRAPLIDDSIPMSFVMSAGLVQVEQSLAKSQIQDQEKFVLVQDCFRHFDLDKVGSDNFHLSFFEMPGAFQFDSVHKRSTIQNMWKLTTSVLGIDKDRLWVSYFKGGKVLGKEFLEDSEAHNIWLETGISEKRVVGLGVKDNFWLQGQGFSGSQIPRKCGTNTELFFDMGERYSCNDDCFPGCKCGRFVEFSNALFVNYEVDSNGVAIRLIENPFSETVIGSERVAMILQSKESVFEIDIYAQLIQLIRKFSRVSFLDRELKIMGERIIADHLRALVYLVADNAPPPGKNGRQRLIKKLIRGVITGIELLDIPRYDFLNLTLDCIIKNSNSSRIGENKVRQRIFSYFTTQEKIFLGTIEQGKKELERQFLNSTTPRVSGEQIVLLEKNMGLPYLLIAKELFEKHIPLPKSEYEQALLAWRKSVVL